jgi:hypothetical protein
VERRAFNFSPKRLRTGVLNVPPVDMLFVEEQIVDLLLIDHLSARAEFVEVPFLRFAQLIKAGGIHSWDGTSLAFASQAAFTASRFRDRLRRTSGKS